MSDDSLKKLDEARQKFKASLLAKETVLEVQDSELETLPEPIPEPPTYTSLSLPKLHKLLATDYPSVISLVEANMEVVTKAHDFSDRHREAVEKSSLIGCFCCVSLNRPSSIKEWIDNGRTALCPDCGIDAILPESKYYPMTSEFLCAMRDRWFGDLED